MINFNGSRRKVLVASIMEIQLIYVRKSKRSELYILTIEPKGLGQRFEKRRLRRPADVFIRSNGGS